jgi:DNA damage-binding protein 1
VLSINGEELEATELEGFLQSEETFMCGNIDHDQLLQITPSCVRLVNQQTLKLNKEWKSSSDKRIGACAYNSSQVLVAMGNDVHYLEIAAGEITEVGKVTMSHEVSCVDIHPLVSGARADVCAVGLWQDITVRVLQLPTLQELHKEQLGGEIIPRSITMVTMEGVSYLLVALGDGCLLYYSIDQSGNISGKKRVILGTKPVMLKPFIAASGGGVNVFACSDRPTIIYSNSRKLLFSSVNLKEVNHMATLNCDAYPNSLVLSMEDSFIIGTVDQIQKLHVRTIPLMETPRRLAHQVSTHTFAVITVRQTSTKHCASLSAVSNSLSPKVDHSPPPGSGEPGTISSIVIFDENTFEALYSYQLQPFENGCSVMSMRIGDSDVFVVGTAFVYPQNKDPDSGRLLVLKWEGGKLSVEAKAEVSGPIYALTTVGEERIVTAVFSTVQVYRLQDKQLLKECGFEGCILAVFLKSMGDFVLVGDLMRSFSLLSYKEDQLEQISLDTNLSPSYMTAVEMLDHDTYLGSDSQHIFTCQKNNDATCEADAPYMVQTARFCIGDTVNVFRQGSLVMSHGTGQLLSGPTILYGTINGSIGILGQVSADMFNKLKPVETSLRNVIKSVGNIDYETYRSFSNEHRSKPAAGFVDGDLLERFLDLPRDKMESVATEAKVPTGEGDETKSLTVEEILKLIEDFARLH